ncbi:protein FAM205A [Sceloporus undulatus]|uniref:protein FAM205A n=1 Tax=Sceloporus undulatus TaxID=8520 RepID=UPI001C4B2E46|nr:protein FAM205A [Sceloporus undulatus]
MRSMTTEHRWGLPKHLQKTLRAFQPSSPPLWSGEAGPQDSTSHTVSGNSEQMFWDRREAPEGKSQETSSLVDSEMMQLASSAVHLPYPAEAGHILLELHIQHKKIQHEWGLPITVQRSMQAFAPVFLEPPKSPWSASQVSDSQGERWEGLIAERSGRAIKTPAASRVKVANEHLDFVAQSTQVELESHVQNLTLEHRWHLPKLLHESMKAFIPQAEEMEEEAKPKKKASEKPGRKPYHEREVAKTSVIAVNGTPSSIEKASLPFLTDEASNHLEFHIQQKYIQHAWGLPSKVIQSLHLFSPFSMNSQKYTGESML